MDVQKSFLNHQNETDAKPHFVLNKLCSICEGIFARANLRACVFSWFYDITNLIESAARGCHICNIVLHEFSLKDIKALQGEINEIGDLAPNAVEKRMKAETRYYYNRGLCLLLRRNYGAEQDVLACVRLKFGAAPKKQKQAFDRTWVRCERSLFQARQWMDQCLSSHHACKHDPAAEITRNQWPTRLLIAGNKSAPNIRLCETSKLEQSSLRYATLSHCWGGCIPTRLLTTNYSTFLSEIAVNELPRTFKDAVEVTRELGLQYLWIDSLCIIQDSVEDWEIESNRMYEIYRNSYISLAAVASADANGGLVYRRSPLSMIPCKVKVGGKGSLDWGRTIYYPGTEAHGDVPLLSRAWVFQETLLPTRVLFFTKDELCWDCNETQQLLTETYPDGRTGDKHNDRQEDRDEDEDKDSTSVRKEWRAVHNEDWESRIRLWNEVISKYSGKELTKFTDKLVAVAGLAFDMGKDSPEVDYLAGLWSYQISKTLLWRTANPTERLKSYVAPTWSWASMKREVHIFTHDSGFNDSLVEIIHAEVEHLARKNPYGAVTGGHVRVKGPLVEAMMAKKPGYKAWEILFPKSQGRSAAAILRNDISAEIEIDDIWLEQILQVAKVFMMPFRILSDKRGSLVLKGMVLSPTYGGQDGQFQRLGVFEIKDQLPTNASFAPSDVSSTHPSDIELETDDSESDRSMSDKSRSPKAKRIKLCSNDESTSAGAETSDHESSQRYSSGVESEIGNDNTLSSDIDDDVEDPIIDGCPQARPYNAIDVPFITMYDLMQLVEEKSGDETEYSLPSLRPLSKNFEAAEHSDSSSSPRDKYCNGIIDATLVHRYKGQLHKHQYPNINSFLSFISLSSYRLIVDKSARLPQHYAESHSGGYFTIVII